MIPAVKELLDQKPELAKLSPEELAQHCNTTDFSYHKDIPIKWFEILVTTLGCKGKIPDYIWELEKVNLSNGMIAHELELLLSSYDYSAIQSAGTAYENWADYFLGRKATLKDIE